MEPIVEVRGVSKRFGERRVLCNLDLSVPRGETLVILGGSGSGKSTLLRCLIGLEQPDEGTIRVCGHDIFNGDTDRLAEIRRRMGMAFQANALFGSMTVAENIEFVLKEHTDMEPTKRRIIARIKLGMVGLEDSMDLMPAQLSGGMRKRAALARALALDPEIVFFDEPSAGLDPVTAAGIDRLLIQLRRAFDVTLVVVTHEMESAFSIAHRLALMHEGRFLIVDSPQAVQACQDPVVRGFLDRLPPPSGDGGAKFLEFLDGLP